jgi:integrase
MARTPREHRLETRDARAKLNVRSEPYWRQIIPGTFIGYRKGKRASAWIARQRTSDGYAEQRIGTPDDQAAPDGAVVLSYPQAVARAQAVQVDAHAPAPRHYGDTLTLNDVLATYIDDHLAGRGSQAITRQMVGRHVAGSIGKKPVTALTAPALRAWHKAMVAKAPTVRGKKQDFDPADPEQLRARKATANRVLSMVKAALNRAWKDDRLPPDLPTYWMKVEPYRLGEEPEPRMLDPGEVTRLLNAAPQDLRELLQGGLTTGGRRGELLALRVRHFDPDTGTVRIYQGKTGKTLTQPLTPEGVALFDRLTAGRDPEEFIFTRADGRPWTMHDVTKPMRTAVEAARLEDVSFKTTRATYGKLLLQATGNIELVAKALGHSDSRITRKHYARYVPSELADAVAMLPRLGIAQASKVSRIRARKLASR